ncbi:MAG TPA: response regulator, partial [Terriglobia bacterium]|nr:response regulator [Terriglobia bacterium]
AEPVSSGEEAIRELAAADSKDPYSLVLMDWHMPGMDGLEASRIIKLGGRLKNIPRIVMVTAFGREEVRTEAEKIGVDNYLLKPVSASTLYDTLMELFGVAPADLAGSRLSRDESSVHDASGARILLVEDNDMNQQVATELLESAGALVTIANHGAEAVRILKEGSGTPGFDVVLMDLQMPEMDGYTATRLLRADPQFKDLPIIAMTAHALVEERQRCLDAGMNDHLTKPIEPDALFATLKRWTKRGGTASVAVSAKLVPETNEVMLPEIEGIDQGGGLKRVAGNRKLYRSLLGQFASKQGDAGAQITAALRSGDHALAGRIAHTAKGVAGNLGIESIQLAAEKLERAIREEDASAPAMAAEFESALRRMVQAIESGLAEGAPSAPARKSLEAFNPELASAAVKRLRTLISANDGDAVNVFQSLETALAGIVDKPQLDALQNALEEFDFDGALSKLAEISRLCGMGQE